MNYRDILIGALHFELMKLVFARLVRFVPGLSLCQGDCSSLFSDFCLLLLLLSWVLLFCSVASANFPSLLIVFTSSAFFIGFFLVQLTCVHLFFAGFRHCCAPWFLFLRLRTIDLCFSLHVLGIYTLLLIFSGSNTRLSVPRCGTVTRILRLLARSCCCVFAPIFFLICTTFGFALPLFTRHVFVFRRSYVFIP